MTKYLIVLSALVMIGNNCCFTMEFDSSAGQEMQYKGNISNKNKQFRKYKENNFVKQFNPETDLNKTSILNGEKRYSPGCTAELDFYYPVEQEESKCGSSACKKAKSEGNNMCTNGQPCEGDWGKYYMGDNANNIDTNEINNNPFSRTNNNNIENYYNKENRTDRKKYNQLRYSTIDGISPDYYNHYGIKGKNSLKESINMELEAGDYTDEKVLKPLNGDDITPL